MATIRLKHVNSFRDRHRRLRYYFRRPGFKALALPGEVGSGEFMSAYHSALAQTAAPVPAGSSRIKPGTLASLIATYYGSAEFMSLAVATQKSRRTTLEAFRREDGDKQVSTLEAWHIQKILAKIDKPHSRRNWVRSVRPVMRLAVAIGMRKTDPLAGIMCKLPKSDGYHTWTDQEIAQYRAYWPLGTPARLAMELALETTSRRGDVTHIGPQHIRNGAIHIRHTKNRADVTIPVTPELQAAIEATPTTHLTFLHTQAGTPYAAKTLGGEFQKRRDAAGLPTRCTMHGLRKGGARRLAESGCTVHEIKSVTGHRSLAEVARYTDKADNERLATEAMAKLKGRRTGTQ
jgi:integrase